MNWNPQILHVIDQENLMIRRLLQIGFENQVVVFDQVPQILYVIGFQLLGDFLLCFIQVGRFHETFPPRKVLDLEKVLEKHIFLYFPDHFNSAIKKTQT
jgi:hypothetical protein